jgi:Tol biopolymer transport system component
MRSRVRKVLILAVGVGLLSFATLCLLGLVVGGRWLVRNWDRIPNVVAGDSYADWSRGGSMPWPGGGPGPTPEGGSIAYSSPRSGRGDIYVWDRATNKSRQLTSSDDFEGQPAFSPDGELIAYQRQEPDHGRWRIWIMNADGTEQRPISQPKRGNDFFPQFTSDGKRIRLLRLTHQGGLSHRPEFVEVDWTTGKEQPLDGPVAEQATDEGGSWEVGETGDFQVWIREKDTGQRRIVAKGSYPLLVNGQRGGWLWVAIANHGERR